MVVIICPITRGHGPINKKTDVRKPAEAGSRVFRNDYYKSGFTFVRTAVLRGVEAEIVVFWDVTVYTLIDIFQRPYGTCFFHVFDILKQEEETSSKLRAFCPPNYIQPHPTTLCQFICVFFSQSLLSPNVGIENPEF